MNIKDTKSSCGRAEDLVAYLYGEASEIEAKGFERHMAECAACRQELNAFGYTRTAIDSAREEAARTFSPMAPDFLQHEQIKQPETRSALAALREFFRLAPLWMQAGVAAASLVLCTLVTLAVFNSEVHLGGTRLALRNSSTERIIEKPVMVERVVQAENTYTQTQVDELINARVQKALAQTQKTAQAGQTANNQMTPVNLQVRNQRSPRSINAGDSRVAKGAVQTPAQGQRRRAPSQFNTDEDDLQLTDLLSQVK